MDLINSAKNDDDIVNIFKKYGFHYICLLIQNNISKINNKKIREK